MDLNLVWLVPAIPFVGFLINALLGRKLVRGTAGVVASLSIFGAWMVALPIFFAVVGGQDKHVTWWTWIPSGNFVVTIGALVDPLSAVMLLVVTTCATLIHIYAIGYMRGDPGYYRFFSYLPLFTFSMLMLVLADNFLQLYFFWEGVGVCSYLLIGYYYDKPNGKPADAAVKAFVVNRVGDFGFGIGVILIFLNFGTLAYDKVFAAASSMPVGILTVITLCLFAGACGKSAQFPLHTWLPDAMEGPTPVSALIHAATMVTAGVYMVARCTPLFSRAPVSLAVVGTVGAISALLAATIALTQFDVKRVLAYSTMSQLGYMFLAEGVGAPSSGIFHLYTHAFFKALLFLAAGSIMVTLEHAYHRAHSDSSHGHAEEGINGSRFYPDFGGRDIDMRYMGGLRRHMPWTYWTFLIASLAIAGIPPLAGFWSKDDILSSAFEHGHYVLYAVGLFVAFLTAFYMFRIVFQAFFGESRLDPAVERHVHESPKVMTLPLAVLAVLAVVAGFVVSGKLGTFSIYEFLGEAPGLKPGSLAEAGGANELILVGASVLAGALGIWWAWATYLGGVFSPEAMAARFRPLYALFYNKWYIDDLYNWVFDRGGHAFANLLWAFDDKVIDGAVNGAAALVRGSSGELRQVQTGRIPNYALGIVTGMFVLVTVYWLAG